MDSPMTCMWCATPRDQQRPCCVSDFNSLWAQAKLRRARGVLSFNEIFVAPDQVDEEN
jgi:hypothetical protein